MKKTQATKGQTYNFVVIGNPIKHSLSPQIHRLFAEQVQVNIDYSTLLVEEKNLEIQVRNFFAQENNKGMNVTIPHKQKVVALCSSLSADAKIAGAVNTLVKTKEGELEGQNTDGVGLVADLNSLNLPLKRQSLLIMGAGGATRGIIAPLLRAGVEKIYLTNRTPEKSRQIIADFNFTDKIILFDWQQLINQVEVNTHIDAVINATSLSMKAEFPQLNANIFNESLSWCYDLFYQAEPTSFVKFCQMQKVAKSYDGLGMLVEQANEAFYLWFNKRCDTKKVKVSLAKILKN